MKIIELAGSPGVGKSTIYKEIVNLWGKESSWVPAHLLYPKAGINFQSLFKFFKNIKAIVQGTHGKIGTVGFMGGRKRFVSAYPEYMDACWEGIMTKQRRSLNNVDLRIEKAQHLSNTIENIQFIIENKTNKTVVLEEGLIHLIDVLLFSDDPDEISRILDVMPLPDAVIDIQTETMENVRRLMSRSVTLTMHERLNAHQLKNFVNQSRYRRNIINRLLEERGVSVLPIDSGVNATINADKIIAFAEKLIPQGAKQTEALKVSC